MKLIADDLSQRFHRQAGAVRAVEVQAPRVRHVRGERSHDERAGRENLWIVTGLASSGFGRGPMAGKLLADYLHTGTPAPVLTEADPAGRVRERRHSQDGRASTR